MYVEKNKFPRIRVNLSPHINLFFPFIILLLTVEKFYSSLMLIYQPLIKAVFSMVKITIFFEEKDGKQPVPSVLRIFEKKKISSL